MTNLFDSFHLEGKITEKHAEDIKEILAEAMQDPNIIRQAAVEGANDQDKLSKPTQKSDKIVQVEPDVHNDPVEEFNLVLSQACPFTLLERYKDADFDRLRKFHVEALAKARVEGKAEENRRLSPFVHHDLQCAVEFEAGACDCGLQALSKK